MDLRLAAYELSARHNLSPEAARRLYALARVDVEPKKLEHTFTNGLAITAAFLGGTGILFWIAANWDGFGRFGRFALLQAAFIAMAIGAAHFPRARPIFSTAAFMTIGGLLAYFGQTYQTGADPWQLFAAWSLLSLPICIATKSDAVWTAWCWVTLTGISLWIATLAGYRWRISDSDEVVYLQGWTLATATCLLLSPLAGRVTGSGTWSFRSSLTLTAILIAITGLIATDDAESARLSFLALAVFGTSGFVLTRPGRLDVFNLAVIGLSFDVVLIGILAETMLTRFEIPNLLMFGLFAASILGGTIHFIVAAIHSAEQHGGAQ